MLTNIAAVALGGAIGALSRYGLTSVATKLWGHEFPWGTLGVNLGGCFLIGVLSTVLGEQGWLSVQSRLLLVTGFLGALTTFSTYSLETVALFQKGTLSLAILNILLNNGISLAMVVTGMWLGGMIVKAH